MIRWAVSGGLADPAPQAHCEHHRKGVHANNYGDLPVWDILLGTFRNPIAFEGECGFETRPTGATVRCSQGATSTCRPTVRGASA